MKLKKIVVLMLVMVLIMSLTLTGCAGAGGKDETSKAKATVDSFVKALRELDVKAMANLIAKGVDANQDDDEGFGDKDSEENKMMKEAFKRMKFTYKSGEVAKDAKEVTLEYEVEAVNAMLLAMAALGGNQKISDMPLSKSDLEVKLVKEDSGWKIFNVEDVIAAATGMADMADAFKSE
ncbi:MAG: hypothetical protein GX900_00070 [Clostridiaceae bacterium]|nr:hypothetical protein [Clostridiaceae bacterium]